MILAYLIRDEPKHSTLKKPFIAVSKAVAKPMIKEVTMMIGRRRICC